MLEWADRKRVGVQARSKQGQAMSQLVDVSIDTAMGYPAGAQAAHDLRNLLATVGLHLRDVATPIGPEGAKAAGAAHALLTRGATLGNDALDRAGNTDGRVRPKGVKYACTIALHGDHFR